MRSLLFVGLCVALFAAAARAQEIDTLNQAIESYNDGKQQKAALGFYRVEEGSAVQDNRFKAEYYLAQSLNKLGLGFSSFFYYSQIIKAGPSHPYYFKAIEGALDVTEAYHDEVLGPNVLNKAYNDRFGSLPPEALSRINYYIALLGYRAGRASEAAQFLQGVPPESSAFAQAQYLSGLLVQRTDPARALQIFRSILALEGPKYRELAGLKEVCHLALGRTLYAMQRYQEASAEYGKLPRFSRHWDEALFEGAYADLLNEDAGSALGKLHSLHSPHLSDEFAPESLNLAAIIYHQNCLFPQVREVVSRFNHDYVPMRDEVRRLLEANPPVETFWKLVAPAGASASDLPPGLSLPVAVQHHLQKNERVDSMISYLRRLDGESAAIKADKTLTGTPLGLDLVDLIGKQRSLVAQVAGKFIQGRLVDLAHLIDVLDGDKEIIGFETTKGEKEFLEQNVDVRARLASQKLLRPELPESGHEYWPFDGEYWPDEIGYYKYTLKNACSPKRKDE